MFNSSYFAFSFIIDPKLDSSEVQDSFEGGVLPGYTPRSRRRGLGGGGWWSSKSKDSYDDQDLMEDQTPCNSGRSSRRSSIVSLIQRRMSRGQDSFDSCCSSSSEGGKLVYRVVVLGSSMVGKTAIISQFLYDSFICGYKETVDEMYQGEFDVCGCELALKIQDTGGSYVDDFPAMLGVSLASADAVLLVYSVADLHSFEEVSRLRDLVHSAKGEDIPIVVVGNKTDLPREIGKEEVEATVMFDWENGYMECCAKDNINVTDVFRELLNQAKSRFDFSNPVGRAPGSFPTTPLIMKRRQSLPQVPAFTRLLKKEVGRSSSPGASKDRKSLVEKRSKSIAHGRRESCKVQ